MTLRPDGAFRVPSTTTAIIIDGCARVYFLRDTVKQLMNLRNVELSNNRHIQFEQESLTKLSLQREQHQLGLRIHIHNSTIDIIESHSVKGPVHDILISNCKIIMMKSFAFSSLKGVNNIILTDNVIENIEIQAFKQFTTQNFVLRGGFIKRAIPSRFLSDVDIVNMLHVDGVTVPSISSLAFLANSPKRVLIENNAIGIIEGDAFHISTRGPITLRNNTIAAFRRNALFGFSVQRDILSNVGLQELLMDNNTITNVEPLSLIFNRSAITLRIDGLNLNATCSCELGEIWKETAELIGMISCWYTLENHYVSIPTFMDSRCGTVKENFWIFIVVGIVIIIIVGLIVTICIVRRENKKRQKLPIVMPEGKTYKETELYVVTEKVDLLTTDL